MPSLCIFNLVADLYQTLSNEPEVENCRSQFNESSFRMFGYELTALQKENIIRILLSIRPGSIG